MLYSCKSAPLERLTSRIAWSGIGKSLGISTKLWDCDAVVDGAGSTVAALVSGSGAVVVCWVVVVCCVVSAACVVSVAGVIDVAVVSSGPSPPRRRKATIPIPMRPRRTTAITATLGNGDLAPSRFDGSEVVGWVAASTTGARDAGESTGSESGCTVWACRCARMFVSSPRMLSIRVATSRADPGRFSGSGSRSSSMSCRVLGSSSSWIGRSATAMSIRLRAASAIESLAVGRSPVSISRNMTPSG